MLCSAHRVYESTWAAINFRYEPPNFSSSYGMNEIREMDYSRCSAIARKQYLNRIRSPIRLRKAGAPLQESGLYRGEFYVKPKEFRRTETHH